MTKQSTNEPQQVNQKNLLKSNAISKTIAEIETEFYRLRKITNQFRKENNIKRPPEDPIHILYKKNIKVALKSKNVAEGYKLLWAEYDRIRFKI